MELIKINQATVDFGGRKIFKNLSLPIRENARIGLVGANGSGKSTLLKLINGDVVPEAGTIYKYPEINIGFLPQLIQLNSKKLVKEYLSILPKKFVDINTALADVERKLSISEYFNDMKKLSRLLEKQEKLLRIIDELEIDRYGKKVRTFLEKFGFTANDFELYTDALSGGQKKILALAKLAMERPDVILLDEPDNHLDIEGKNFLEGFISDYPGAVIIVSHDRYLLDEVVEEIAEIENGKLTIYKGNYSSYKTEKEINRLRQHQLYTAQQKEIARIEAAIQRFEQWARIVEDERHIKQARHRRKMLERMEESGEIIEDITQEKVLDIQLQGWRGSSKALEIFDLCVDFDNSYLFENLNLEIRHKDRIGLVGSNGSGKSVLLKTILGEIKPKSGEIKIGPSTHIGYYSQEQQTLADWLQRTPYEFIRHSKPMSESNAVAQLIKFSFEYDQIHQPIETLSGGEQSRLQLLRIMLKQPNILLLDEPTNNLDIVSAEALESALDEFDGAIFIISHDRYFLDQTVDTIFELKEKKLTRYEGGYTDYLVKNK